MENIFGKYISYMHAILIEDIKYIRRIWRIDSSKRPKQI